MQGLIKRIEAETLLLFEEQNIGNIRAINCFKEAKHQKIRWHLMKSDRTMRLFCDTKVWM